MNSPVSIPDATDAVAAELLSLIPGITVLPDEDPLLLEDLRAALLRELAPGTAYERAIVEDLVNLQWEVQRERRLRDAAILIKFAEVAAGTLSGGELTDFTVYANKTHWQVAEALTSSNPKARHKAEAQLLEAGFSRQEVAAEAYRRSLKQVEGYNRALADLERRRRQLRAEYDNLKAARLARQATAADIDDVDLEADA